MSKRRSRNDIVEHENSDIDTEESDTDSEDSSSDDEDDSQCGFSSDDGMDATDDDEDENVPLINWKRVPFNEPIRVTKFPLTAKPGITVDVDESWTALDYVKLFLDNNIMNTIVLETNKYADKHLAKKKRSKRASKLLWYPVTIDEMWVFFAVLIYQAIIIKPKQRWYWTRNKMFETSFVRNMMNMARFEHIMKFLHFADDDIYDPETHPCPKLRKIWDIFQAINANFEKTYVPEQDISIDESLMAFRGRLSWKQFIPSKRSKCGVKSYVMCESNSSYILKSVIYTGKETEKAPLEDVSITTAIVMNISEKLLHQGYTLVMDNFYNSPELFKLLSSSQTNAYGTLRANRKGLPENFSKIKLKKDEAACWVKEGLVVIKWHDKKDISLISTCHDVSFQETVNKIGGKKIKPQIVIDYNKTMGGVDRADQQMSTYSLMRQQQKKYYKKIFRHLLDQCLLNAYILYKKYTNKNAEHLAFFTTLVGQILKAHQTEDEPSAKRGRPVIQKSLFGDTTPTRLTGRHFPSIVPATDNKKNSTRRCCVCSAKGVRKESRYCCQECDVGLCVDPCFRIYHTQEEY